MTVAVADRKRPAVRAERDRPHRPHDRAERADLTGPLEAWADLAQPPRVEERDGPVVAADRKHPTVAAERVVEDARAAAVQRRESRRAPQERSEEIAPRRDRVVEIDALAREQQRAVEARLDKRLRAQPLRDRRSRLTLRGASRRQCDRSRADRRNEEQDGERKQGAQTPVRASERGAALLQELTLEPVQACVLAGGVGPLERRREASPAVKLARVPSRRLPLRGRLRQVPMQTATLRVLLHPTREPRPPLEQRLVNEFDRAVVGDEQPALDQRREHAPDPRVIVGIELLAGRAPTREDLALAAGDEAEQDPARDLLVVLAQRPEGRFRVAADRAANTSRPLVRGMGQGASVAVAPEVEQRRREKRQPARLAGDIIDERVDERRLDLEPRPLGGSLDRAAELTCTHRPEQDVVRADEIRQLDVRREAPEEVGAQRDQDQRAPLWVPGRLGERVYERTPLVLGDGCSEELLQLVDGKHKPLARQHAPQRSGELGRRSFARTEKHPFPPKRRQQASPEER